MALFMVKTWIGNKVAPIYGAEWAGTSDPSWVRTDAAVGFSAPNPYYAGMSGTPSSPFDNIMPWAGMRRVTDASAGELVEIPKFYYKWTRDGVKMKLQISMSQFDGSHVSPAHADRGDGVGERDYVYVGRYHCASDYKSKAGVVPVTNITRTSFATNIHNLASNCYQIDYAMYWTICMLYLVEYASWNSQLNIGYGICESNNVLGNMGYTDTMPYHTGTNKTARNTYGLGVQYRYIEGLWDNCWDLLGGIYTYNGYVYVFKNLNDYALTHSSNKATNTNIYINTDGFAISFTELSNVSGLEYVMMAKANNNYSDDYATRYITDTANFSASGTNRIIFGGNYDKNLSRGLFSVNGKIADTISSVDVGSRLMVLPPSRLSA